MYHSLDDQDQLLINNAVFIYSQCRDILSTTLAENREKKPDFANALLALLTLASDRSTSLIWNLQAGYIWDAQIMLRCVIEANCKLLFLCFADDTEQQKRVTEYWHDLDEVRKLRYSERIKSSLSFADPDDPSTFWLAQQVLSDDEDREIRSRWPRAARQSLEHKWTFFEMLGQIDQYVVTKGMKPVFQNFMLGYGYSSHFIHSDERALLLMYDLREREEDEKKKLVRLHICILLETYLVMPVLALKAICHAFGIADDRVAQLMKTVDTFLEVSKDVAQEFYDTQTDLAEYIRQSN